jgi:hypothetical protein
MLLFLALTVEKAVFFIFVFKNQDAQRWID